MKVECSTCVQLLERRSTCRHWSEREELDTFRPDLLLYGWNNRHYVMLHTKKHGMLGELTALLALAGSVPRGVRGRPH